MVGRRPRAEKAPPRAGAVAKGELSVSASPGVRARVEIAIRRGTVNLVLPLAHEPSFSPESIREVKLLDDAGELFCHVTAWAGRVG